MTSSPVKHEPATGHILVVCTGNVCRSPYLERLLAAQLADTGIKVTSAGTGALVGKPMDPESAKRLVDTGGDPEGFAARQITAEMIRDADLILTATRHHRTEVVQLEPKGLRHVLALADLADLTDGMPTKLPAPSFLEDPDANRVARVVTAASRRRSEIQPRSDARAEIVDPFRRKPEVFDQMAAQINAFVPPVIRILRGE